MFSKKKIIVFLIILIVNIIVILSFIFLTKKIREDDHLKLNYLEIPASGGDFLF